MDLLGLFSVFVFLSDFDDGFGVYADRWYGIIIPILSYYRITVVLSNDLFLS